MKEQEMAILTPFVYYHLPDTSEIGFIQENKLGSRQFVANSFDGKQIIQISYTQPIYFSFNELTSEKFSHLPPELSTENTDQNKKTFENLFAKAQELISSNQLQKIVLSRTITHKVSIDCIATFKQLAQQNPHAFTYFLYHPTCGYWMGATPEILINYKNPLLQTISLAGTKQKNEEWTKKEVLEQQVVTDYIENKLIQLASTIKKGKTETIESGLMNHLKTTFNAIIEPQKISELISTLHPTPAVCGIPTPDSYSFILKNEGYNRELYTGYLGFTDTDTSTLFVNLRCAKLFSNAIQLFVGGGINALSDCEKEWNETIFKSENFLKALVLKP